MDNRLETLSNLFEGTEIRSVWDSEKKKTIILVWLMLLVY